MAHSPSVSVIMPTYGQAEFLPEALDSLAGQHFDDFELVVVDDGSTDATPEILQREARFPGMKVLRQDNAGTAFAINAGIALARGEWWTWVSSDNIYLPQWLQELTLVAANDREVGAVFSDYWWDEGRGHVPPPIPHDPRPSYRVGDLVKTRNCFFGPSFLVHKKVWRAAGPHRGCLAHDYDHWLRVEEACLHAEMRIHYYPGRLAVYRAHPGRQTVRHRGECDAARWQASAMERRERRAAITLRDPKGVSRTCASL